jgi:hypothetical protein
MALLISLVGGGSELGFVKDMSGALRANYPFDRLLVEWIYAEKRNC